jgi:hypothetical protein
LKTCPERALRSAFSGPENAAARIVPGAAFEAAAKISAAGVSLWKNEGKNRAWGTLGGGLKAPHTLYDS